MSLQSPFANAKTVEKHRLVANLGHNDGFAGLHHPAGNPFADSIFDAARSILVQAVRSDDAKLIRILVNQRYDSAGHTMMTPEGF